MTGPIRKPPPKDPLERWNLLGVAQLSEPLPPIPWVCQALRLAPGAVTLVAGYGYSRKTMAMQSLGLSVAAGERVWGVWTPRQGPFLHLDYEQGRRLTQERYQRLARGMGLTLAELPKGSLRVGVMPHAYLDEQGVFDELVALVKDAVFVLVDSLRAAFPHADENSSEVRSYLDVLSRVSERTGAAIAVIHHARKPNAQNGGTATHAIRGSSALFDACQSVFVFEGAKDTPTTVRHEKDRVQGATLEDFGLTSEDVPGAEGPRDGLRVVHLEAEQVNAHADSIVDAKREAVVIAAGEKILSAIIERGTVEGSRRDLCAIVGVKRDTFDAALPRLISGGWIIRKGTHKDPVWTWGNGEPSPIPRTIPQASPGDAKSNHPPSPTPFRVGDGSQGFGGEQPSPDGPPLEDRGNLFGDLIGDV